MLLFPGRLHFQRHVIQINDDTRIEFTFIELLIILCSVMSDGVIHSEQAFVIAVSARLENKNTTTFSLKRLLSSLKNGLKVDDSSKLAGVK